ncbi:MAG: PTS sugar transporter subunit IIA [Treponema sp.]|jgi:PTS system nitrogen regulatory IIA component|nr:PTS sugar transporter subunit IIA [Treponema sp.]
MTDGDIITIEEVAKYLRVSEHTIYNWAQKGEIPAAKIGSVWRFKRVDIERWVDNRFSVPPPKSETIHAETIIVPDRIVFLDYPNKRDALSVLADNLAQAPQARDRQELITEILKREELMSTAIGEGIAIPHVRLASVTDMIVSVGISRTDISDFHALDDKPVRLLFMIAASYNQHTYYLQTLSFFSRRLKNKRLRDELLGAETSQHAYKLLVE